MRSFPITRILLLSVCGIILGGCSSIVNSHLQKAPMMEAYAAADNADVMAQINAKLKEPKWYNSSVINTGDEVMWRLESGSMNFNMGNFAQSVEQFSTAERLIANYDERAKISMRDAGAEIGMSVTNLNTLPYRGFCRDRIALCIYKSLAYLGMDKESSFRAQLRRLRNEQKKVLEDYKEFFEAEKAELEAAKAKNPEAAEKAKENVSEEKLESDPNNAEFTAGIKEVKTIANKGYGGFLNPAAIFLSGLGSIRDENYDNARIDFQRLYEAMPQNPMIQQYYVSVLRAADRPIPAPLGKVKPFDFPLDRDCVYLVFANGVSAAFKQIAVYFPIMTAWPMCEFYPAPFEKITAHVNNAQYPSMILADMDGILAQEFKERLPGIVTRIVLSTLIKEGAKYAGTYVAARQNIFVGIGVYIGSSIYTAVMNTADTRTWEILPKEFQLTQFPMPADRKLSIDVGAKKVALEIPSDARSAIIFVNAPSQKNLSCHIFPLKSK
ncbi:MAG: hypothetical protein PHS41_10350 [Victivallaceae bacterium]|nr:hypothetical protein [Victivallaceae bacterium]